MPTLTRARGRRALAATASLGVLALTVTACGSSGGAKDADPAQAVPASAPIYIQATIKPDGDLRADTEAVLKTFGVDDPAAEIVKALKNSQDSPADAADVDKVVAAVGSQAGIFVSSFTGDADAAVVLTMTDPDQIRDVLETTAKRDGDRQTSYKDVDYWIDDSGDVSGIVDDYVVAGTERAFRTVVDTVKGDDVDTIADSSDYQAGLDAVDSDGALATVYVSTEGVINALGRSGGIPAAQMGQIREQLAKVGGETSVAALVPGSDSVTVEAATLGLKEGGESDPAAANAALAALPGDAWLGIGLPHIGQSLRDAMQQSLQLAATSGQDVSGQIQMAEQALGVDIEDDLLSWMGDGGVFARGGSITDIGGALVIQATDPAKAKQALTKLTRLVPQFAQGVRTHEVTGVAGVDEGVEFRVQGFPFPIVAAVGGDKFVLGVGATTVEQALSSGSTLADSASYKAAAAALGDVKPAFFVDVAAVNSLLSGLVPAGDPNADQVVAALDKIATVAAGTQRDGSTQHSKLVVTLK